MMQKVNNTEPKYCDRERDWGVGGEGFKQGAKNGGGGCKKELERSTKRAMTSWTLPSHSILKKNSTQPASPQTIYVLSLSLSTSLSISTKLLLIDRR